MKLLKNRAAWRRFLRNDCGMSKADADGEREPLDYPCYGYAVVRSYAYEEQMPMYLYERDLETMLNHVRIASIEMK
jgi:hypothetical protein